MASLSCSKYLWFCEISFPDNMLYKLCTCNIFLQLLDRTWMYWCQQWGKPILRSTLIVRIQTALPPLVCVTITSVWAGIPVDSSTAAERTPRGAISATAAASRPVAASSPTILSSTKNTTVFGMMCHRVEWSQQKFSPWLKKQLSWTWYVVGLSICFDFVLDKTLNLLWNDVWYICFVNYTGRYW